MPLLLTLNSFFPLLCCSQACLWTSKCRLERTGMKEPVFLIKFWKQGSWSILNAMTLFSCIQCKERSHHIKLVFIIDLFLSFDSFIENIFLRSHCGKSVQIQSFSGPHFPVFKLNTEICRVNLRIQSEYRKIRTKKNSVSGHCPCSVCCDNSIFWVLLLFCLDV